MWIELRTSVFLFSLNQYCRAWLHETNQQNSMQTAQLYHLFHTCTYWVNWVVARQTTYGLVFNIIFSPIDKKQSHGGEHQTHRSPVLSSAVRSFLLILNTCPHAQNANFCAIMENPRDYMNNLLLCDAFKNVSICVFSNWSSSLPIKYFQPVKFYICDFESQQRIFKNSRFLL